MCRARAIMFLVSRVVITYGLDNLVSRGATIHNWCVRADNQEARDKFKGATSTIQIALHFSANSSPYAVLVSAIYVFITLGLCAIFTSRRLLREIIVCTVPITYATIIVSLIG